MEPGNNAYLSASDPQFYEAGSMPVFFPAFPIHYQGYCHSFNKSFIRNCSIIVLVITRTMHTWSSSNRLCTVNSVMNERSRWPSKSFGKYSRKIKRYAHSFLFMTSVMSKRWKFVNYAFYDRWMKLLLNASILISSWDHIANFCVHAPFPTNLWSKGSQGSPFHRKVVSSAISKTFS